MPFTPCEWVDGRPTFPGGDEPLPELRHTEGKWFCLLNTFAYRVPAGDPEAGALYVVPGEDAPGGVTGTFEDAGGKVVVPPRLGKTDLASVPWFLFWLVASYGNHTRAALLHDALYVEAPAQPPVSRQEADRLLLAALRERTPTLTRFRHWLIWAAVAAFGRGRLIAATIFLHALAVWVLGVTALVWEWGDELWEPLSLRHVLLVLAVIGGLSLLGAAWRAGVDVPAGWLFPLGLLGAGLVGPLLVLGSPRELDEVAPFWLLVLALVLVALGGLWGTIVHPTLRGWLWPTALIGLGVIAPVVLILVATPIVWLIDLGAAAAASLREGRWGGFPPITPFRRRL